MVYSFCYSKTVLLSVPHLWKPVHSSIFFWPSNNEQTPLIVYNNVQQILVRDNSIYSYSTCQIPRCHSTYRVWTIIVLRVYAPEIAYPHTKEYSFFHIERVRNYSYSFPYTNHVSYEVIHDKSVYYGRRIIENRLSKWLWWRFWKLRLWSIAKIWFEFSFTSFNSLISTAQKLR